MKGDKMHSISHKNFKEGILCVVGILALWGVMTWVYEMGVSKRHELSRSISSISVNFVDEVDAHSNEALFSLRGQNVVLVLKTGVEGIEERILIGGRNVQLSIRPDGHKTTLQIFGRQHSSPVYRFRSEIDAGRFLKIALKYGVINYDAQTIVL
ncbi:hypothetical protein K8R32_04105 [bacterium]|nr:hypothetical protein [bacterium]